MTESIHVQVASPRFRFCPEILESLQNPCVFASLRLAPVLNLSRLIRCGSLSLRPSVRLRQLPTPPRGGAVDFAFGCEQSNSTGGTLTLVSVSFSGAAFVKFV